MGQDEDQQMVDLDEPELHEAPTSSSSELEIAPKVPMKVKLSYAAVNFSLELQATIWALFALNFMTDNAKMEPKHAGWVAALYRIWDALNDPVVGNYSDNTRSLRWGRRRGWMMAGIVPFAIAYFVMWLIPFGPENQAGLFIYYLIVKMVSDLGYTCVNVPHLALLNDLTKDYHERFQINSIRTVGIAVGSLLSMILVAISSKVIHDDGTRFLVLAGSTGSLSILAVFNCVYQTRHYKGLMPDAPGAIKEEFSMSIVQRIRLVFSVKAAALAIGMYVCAASTTQSTLAIATYYMKNYLRFDLMKLATVIITAQLVGICTAGVVIAIQKKIEKRNIYFVGSIIWLAFYVVAPIVTPENSKLLFVLGPVMGIGMATAMLIPIGYVSDAAEFIDYQTHKRLEGTMFGCLHLINKSTVGLVVFTFEHVLQATGYNSHDPLNLNAQTTLALKATFSVIPGFLLILTMIFNYFMPMNKQTNAVVTAALKERKENEAGNNLLKEVDVIEETKPPYVTFFLVDGLDRHVFSNLLSQGKLPNVSKMINEGAWIKNGVTALPSITGFAFFPYITGEDASKSGIMGLRWFNRNANSSNPGIRNYVGKTNKWMNLDFTPEIPTIFEKFSRNHSFSIQCYANRGVKKGPVLGWAMVTAKFKKMWVGKLLQSIPFFWRFHGNDWESYETKIFDEAIKDLNNRPKVQWITVASTDSCHHMEGASEDYVDCVKVVDRLIGKYENACKDLGMHKDRYYCFISDHGVNDVHNNVDVGIELSQLFGFKLYNSNGSNAFKDTLDDSLAPYAEFDLITCLNGNASLYLYFKHPDHLNHGSPWSQCLTYEQVLKYPFKGRTLNLVKETLEIEGVEFVMTRGSSGSNDAMVHSVRGVAIITYSNEKYTYKVTSGDDPLELPEDLVNKSLTAPEWLNSTYDSKFPYAPVRIHRMMSCEGAGDLMIFSKNEYDFGKDCEPIIGSYKGCHGHLCKDQMLVPMIIKGPSVKAGSQVTTATSEDFGATVLDLMGSPSFGTGQVLRSIINKEEYYEERDDRKGNNRSSIMLEEVDKEFSMTMDGSDEDLR